jgi:hypothetical protein
LNIYSKSLRKREKLKSLNRRLNVIHRMGKTGSTDLVILMYLHFSICLAVFIRNKFFEKIKIKINT